MPRDPWDDPQARRWARNVLDDMVPKLRESAISLSIVPDNLAEGDVKYAVELGFSMMLDKPIILLVQPGMQVPGKMLAVADAVVEFDPDDRAGTQHRLEIAMTDIVGP